VEGTAAEPRVASHGDPYVAQVKSDVPQEKASPGNILCQRMNTHPLSFAFLQLTTALDAPCERFGREQESYFCSLNSEASSPLASA
jgi:hypothetical protein